MNIKNPEYDVAIVGGGPVGLFLACCLAEKGIACTVLEKRSKGITHSRSIGIHPVLLEKFNTLGLAEPFVERGVKVEQGMAFAGPEHIGTLSFASCPPPFRFILTLPQYITEQLLVNHLHTYGSHILQRGSAVVGLIQTEEGVRLHLKKEGRESEIRARYVVGCDGKNSLVRREATISFDETVYDDTYIMGDFSDNTNFGSSAAVFLCKEGLIESFPLTENIRRWVVKTDRYLPEASRDDIEARVIHRIHHSLQGIEHQMMSSFGVQKGLAGTLAKDRIVLAGDAAHIVSPIGGQGMNLGWLDAWELAECFQQIMHSEADPKSVLKRYSDRQLKVARKIIRRAEFNMALGRKSSNLRSKKWTLQLLVNTPASSLMARLFTMRGLQTLPF